MIGTTHIDALEAFEADPETDAIVMIGEIGGDAEERAAAYIGQRDQAGRGLRRRVHGARGQDHGPRRGDRVRLGRAPRRPSSEALEAAGVRVGKTPSETAALMREIVSSL